MKRKILLLITLCLFAYASNSQQSDGYIRHAVPPFDNKTGTIDWSKIEILPIRLYKAAPGFQPAQNRYGDNNVLSVTDNTDIQVFPSVNSQHEQHMTVSKINPKNIILCSNTPFYMGYYVSQDGGATWFGSDYLPPGNFASYGDPATAVDDNGHLFLEAIQNGGGGFVAFKSTTQGNTWGSPVLYSYTPVSFDKQMMAIDNMPGSPFINNIYTAWTDFAGTYKVLFNRSTNGGTSYNSYINLHNSWGQGTGVATGVNGEVYVCWANYSVGPGIYPADGLGFARSFNGGALFDTTMTPVFPYVGIRPNNSPNPLFNNTRVNDFPSIAVDKSCGPYRGRIYVVVGAKQNGTGKAVSYLRYSNNQGTSWSPAFEVNISNGRQNWFPWVTVDDVTGTVSVAYLSLDEATGFATNTYLAYSFDGGNTWSNIKVSDVSHVVAAISGFASGYCGDYIANAAYGNKNYVVWNDNRTGTWKNYFSRVDFSQFGLYSSNTDLNINGPVDLTLPTATQLYYRAVGNISTPVASSFSAQSGTSVTMLCGGHITLNTGFIAHAGSHFQAFIGNATPCVNTVHRDIADEQISNLQNFLKPAYTGDPDVQFSLYPNPANSEMTMEYLLTDPSEVSLMIQDLNGKEVKNVMNNLSQLPGINKVSFDVSGLQSGIYLYKLITNNYVKTGKFSKVD